MKNGKGEKMLIDIINPNLNAKIVCGDTLKELKVFKDGFFDLIVTSPPYNVGKEYEVKQSIELYLQSQEEVIKELIRVLSNEGSICWQIGNYVKDGEVFPLDIFYYQIFKKYGLQLRNRIVWHYRHGLQAKNKFSGRYETILWFTKSKNYIFNLDEVRVPSKYPGKLYHKGEKKGKPSGNPLGKNPSDVWEVVLQDWETAIWDIPNVKANHLEKTEHPCQFPVELVERCILALTNKNSWVLDPYSGVGSTLIASLKNDRNSIGIDKELKYCDIAKDRIEKLKRGELKTRPIDRPIYIPSATEKVAQIPVSWIKEIE
ncbi:DNA-methyltransferase [Arsenicibacter rosenii]|uniref:Methyltransferase n=1 Tax=Arsenicibacter rosenii TaxID=1750698 RepID=A0A1S2VIP3_9BACT|nr:site-specific DNA-methyltransferase [Arsenicibacter rosenii]OIN58631.1 site-specific DNA-methyltransferase [Arsenicibacter rosenii]